MSTSPTSLVALVTGANRGLGLEISRQLAARGVTVLMAGRSEQAIVQAAEVLRGEGLMVEPVVLDITDSARIEGVRADLEARFGRLDILINNAGMIVEGGFFQSNAATVSQEHLEQTFRVNLFAPIALTQALLPLLRAAPAARIVNASSILGSLGVHSQPQSPLTGLAPLAYDASKAALNMFTVHLAEVLADTPIKVNSGHPGWVKTALGTDAAPMEVGEGARTAVELALLPADGPSGRFIHLGEELPW